MDDQPYAEIEQYGRWTWIVSVHHGPIQWGPDGVGWFVLGRRRAERKAQRALARYVAERQRTPIRVRLTEREK